MPALTPGSTLGEAPASAGVSASGSRYVRKGRQYGAPNVRFYYDPNVHSYAMPVEPLSAAEHEDLAREARIEQLLEILRQAGVIVEINEDDLVAAEQALNGLVFFLEHQQQIGRIQAAGLQERMAEHLKDPVVQEGWAERGVDPRVLHRQRRRHEAAERKLHLAVALHRPRLLYGSPVRRMPPPQARVAARRQRRRRSESRGNPRHSRAPGRSGDPEPSPHERVAALAGRSSW